MSEFKKVILEPANKEHCPKCRNENSLKVKEIKEIYQVRGEKIEIDAKVRYCNECSEIISDEDLDTENINKAFEKYRLLNNFLSPVEIETIRNKYGLSQRGLATILDWSPATIARYETGALPSQSHQSILIMIRDNIEYVKELFERKHGELGRLDKKRLEEKLQQIEEEIFERDIVNILTNKYQRFKG